MSRREFDSRAQHQAGPIDRLAPVTPSDIDDLPNGLTRGLFVGVPGVLTVFDRHGGMAELVSGAGQYHPVRVKRVLATGTTASGIVALY